MTIKRKFHIKDKVIYEDYNHKIKAKVVYIFKAFKIPKKKKVLKYYSKEAINPTYAYIFGPARSERIVIKTKDKQYIVCPMSERRQFSLTHRKDIKDA